MNTGKTKRNRVVALAGFAAFGLIATWPGRILASNANPSNAAHPIASAFVDLPLSFEPNQGQSEAGIQFVARGPGYTLLLNNEQASFQFSGGEASSTDSKGGTFELRLAGSKKAQSPLFGRDEQPSKSSYFTGADPRKWITGIPNFGRVERRDVYDGVDVSYRGLQGQLECEFTIAPYATPETIQLQILGAQRLHIDSKGDVVFSVANLEFRLRRPDSHQKVNGSRRTVTVRYIVRKNIVTFRLGNYDSRKTLFIKPVLSYADLSQAAANICPPGHVTRTGTKHRSDAGHSNSNQSTGELPCAGL